MFFMFYVMSYVLSEPYENTYVCNLMLLTNLIRAFGVSGRH
jgi:hypothetical protein